MTRPDLVSERFEPTPFGGLYKNMDQYDRSDNLGARIKVSLTKIRANRLRAAVL